MPRTPFNAAQLRTVCPPRPRLLAKPTLQPFQRRMLADVSPATTIEIPMRSQEEPQQQQTPQPQPDSTSPPQKVTRSLPISLFTLPAETPVNPEIVPQTAPAPASHPAPSSMPQPTSSYTVSRTPSNNLPVYEHRKGGGTLKLSTVRKVSGHADTLRVQLQQVLEPTPASVHVNPLTNHVVVKGFYKAQIQDFLRKSGY